MLSLSEDIVRPRWRHREADGNDRPRNKILAFKHLKFHLSLEIRILTFCYEVTTVTPVVHAVNDAD